MWMKSTISEIKKIKCSFFCNSCSLITGLFESWLSMVSVWKIPVGRGVRFSKFHIGLVLNTEKLEAVNWSNSRGNGNMIRGLGISRLEAAHATRWWDLPSLGGILVLVISEVMFSVLLRTCKDPGAYLTLGRQDTLHCWIFPEIHIEVSGIHSLRKDASNQLCCKLWFLKIWTDYLLLERSGTASGRNPSIESVYQSAS